MQNADSIPLFLFSDLSTKPKVGQTYQRFLRRMIFPPSGKRSQEFKTPVFVWSPSLIKRLVLFQIYLLNTRYRMVGLLFHRDNLKNHFSLVKITTPIPKLIMVRLRAMNLKTSGMGWFRHACLLTFPNILPSPRLCHMLFHCQTIAATKWNSVARKLTITTLFRVL